MQQAEAQSTLVKRRDMSMPTGDDKSKIQDSVAGKHKHNRRNANDERLRDSEKRLNAMSHSDTPFSHTLSHTLTHSLILQLAMIHLLTHAVTLCYIC